MAEQNKKLKKMKILLIEDEEMLASMYETKFKNDGFEIDLSHDGEEGLAKAESTEYDVILLDVILPKLDGFSVLKKLREGKKNKKTPVFLLTNLGQEEDMKKGKEMGASGYLVKANFTPAQIISQIKEFFKK